MSFLSVPISLFPVQPQRKIGSIKVQVILSENTNDTLTITKQPVQQGASITDHAYKEPTAFSATMLFRDDLDKSLSEVYQDLLDLQISRVPFDIITPKRIYKSMLMATLSQTTDKNTENCLSINMSFQEIIIVNVTVTSVPRVQQKTPGITGATEKVGKKSALLTLSQGIRSAVGL